MGVITIEIPQKIKRTYHIESKAKAQRILDSLDQPEKPVGEEQESDPTSKNGSNDNRFDDLESALNSVVGMWSYRKESTVAIAKRLRAGWNRRDGK